jgi:hypothetical protein
MLIAHDGSYLGLRFERRSLGQFAAAICLLVI